MAEPNEASGDPGDKTALLKAAILGQGIAVESVDDLGGALGTSSREGIRLLNGLSPAMEFTTLVHEYAHQLMHASDDRPTARDTRELEAEAVTFVVGGAIGLDTAVASADYISLYRGDREALVGSLDRIQRTASVILAFVNVGASRCRRVAMWRPDPSRAARAGDNTRSPVVSCRTASGRRVSFLPRIHPSMPVHRTMARARLQREARRLVELARATAAPSSWRVGRMGSGYPDGN